MYYCSSLPYSCGPQQAVSRIEFFPIPSAVGSVGLTFFFFEKEQSFPFFLHGSSYFDPIISRFDANFAPFVFLMMCFLQVYDRDGNQVAHFVKGDPYLKVTSRIMHPI